MVTAPTLTVTYTAPATPGGAATTICVPVLLTVNPDVTAVPPKLTAVAPVNPTPVTVTIVPPRWLPECGDTEVTSGP